MKKYLVVLMSLVAGSDSSAESIFSSRFFQPPNASVVYYEGKTILPGEGYWVMDDSKNAFRLLNGFAMRDDPNEKKEKDTGKEPVGNGQAEYTLLIATDKLSQKEMILSLKNPITKEEKTLTWNMGDSRIGDQEIHDLFEKRQRCEMYAYRSASKTPVISDWIEMLEAKPVWQRREDRLRNVDVVSLMDVLGGGAAVRETLQMNLLSFDDSGSGKRNIALADIKGVEVKSLPFDTMLNGKTSWVFELAKFVPNDRLFVNMANPDVMMDFLEKGTEFIANAGNLLKGDAVRYDLKEKYMERLGVNPQTLKRCLSSGLIKDMALMAPDLFFLDGTDMTIITKMTGAKSLLTMLGWTTLTGLPDDCIVERAARNGGKSYWLRMDDFLVISTNRKEAESVQKLCHDKGLGSLGLSTEFQYMMTKLPKKDNTRAFVYFSDPFIRRLVGPEVKIGQLRRVIEKGKLEIMTSASLLARSQGRKGFDSVDELVKLGYIPEALSGQGFSIRPDGVAHSVVYGQLGDLTGLLSVPVDKVTEGEAEAYAEYLANYNEYWAEYFDPIAIRLDETGKGEYETCLFILPLIGNSLYTSMKRDLLSGKNETALKRPVFSRKPVLQFSINVSEARHNDFVDHFIDFIREKIQMNSDVVQDLGPSISLAVHDSDPVIVLGSGDLAGLFGAEARSGRSDGMMAIAAIASLLTRPCTLAIQTQNPERTLDFIRKATWSGSSQFETSYRRDIQISYYQIGERDMFVCSVSLADILKIRLYITVKDGFVLISNTPESGGYSLASIDSGSFDGIHLEMNPQECERMRPGLFLSYAEQQQKVAQIGMGMLYPIIKSGLAPLEQAEDSLMKLLGYSPVHPYSGRWVYRNMRIESTHYGDVYRNRIPDYVHGDKDFGLFKHIHALNVGLQFEDDGLRATLKWKTSGVD